MSTWLMWMSLLRNCCVGGLSFMSLYDLIAAGHRGQTFNLLARRFLITEPQAARAVRFLLPAILPGFEAWVSSPGGLSNFLNNMSRGNYQNTLSVPGTFSNHFERDRRQQLLEIFRSAHEVDGADLARAVEGSGVGYRVLMQMLPFVALLLMGALRVKTEQPFRAILNERLGARMKLSADPFADLGDLVAWEAKGHRPSLLANVFEGLFGRQAARPPSRIAANPA